eukprot:5632575-Pyramimonas_sp.AAC.1
MCPASSACSAASNSSGSAPTISLSDAASISSFTDKDQSTSDPPSSRCSCVAVPPSSSEGSCSAEPPSSSESNPYRSEPMPRCCASAGVPACAPGAAAATAAMAAGDVTPRGGIVTGGKSHKRSPT